MMYIWTLLTVVVGFIVAVSNILLIVVLLRKAQKRKKDGVIIEHTKEPAAPKQSVCVTDPYSGKLVNLERVSNASSLRSTQGIGFISYDNKSLSRHGGGRVTPLSGNGTLNSEKLNSSMASTSQSTLERSFKTSNVNPLFSEELKSPPIKKHKKPVKLRAREI